MVQLKFISLFTLSPGSNRNQQGGVSLQYGLRPFVVAWWHVHVAGRNLEEILQKKKKKKPLKWFTSSLNVMVGYLCMQSLPVWAWMFVSVLERQRAILEDGYYHTLDWQRYCRKRLFGLVGQPWITNLRDMWMDGWMGNVLSVHKIHTLREYVVVQQESQFSSPF